MCTLAVSQPTSTNLREKKCEMFIAGIKIEMVLREQLRCSKTHDSSATLCVSGRLALNGNSTWRPKVTRGGWYLTTDKILTNQVDMLENLYKSPIKRNMLTFNHSKWYRMLSIQSIPRKNSCYWVCSLGPGWWGLFFGNSPCYSQKKKHPFKNPATSPRNKRILLKI